MEMSFQPINNSEFYSQPNSEFNNSSNKENMYQSQSINVFQQPNSQNPFSKIALSDSQYDNVNLQLSKSEMKPFKQNSQNFDEKTKNFVEQKVQNYQEQQKQLQNQGQRVAFGALKGNYNIQNTQTNNVNPQMNKACVFQKPDAKVYNKNGQLLPNIFNMNNNNVKSLNVSQKQNLNVIKKPKLQKITQQNINQVPQYKEQILESMKQKAVQQFEQINYFDSNPAKNIEAIQNGFSESERVVIVNWINTLQQQFKLLPQTYYLAIKIFDNVMQKQRVKIEQLQPVALTSIFISSKIEEIYPPDLHEFVQTTDGYCLSDQIISLEGEILRLIGFNFTYPTSWFFLESFLTNKQFQFGSSEKIFSCYLLELGTYFYDLIKFNPCQLALGAIYYTYQLKEGSAKSWQEIDLVKKLSVKMDELTKVAKLYGVAIFQICKRMEQQSNDGSDSELEEYSVNIKYADPRYSCVSEFIQKINKKQKKQQMSLLE